jgi:signal transduction histidine kinase
MPKNSLLTALCIFMCMPFLYGQNEKKIDSLINLTTTQNNDTTKIDALLQLVIQYRGSDAATGAKSVETALQLAQKINDKKRIANATMYKGMIYFYVEKYDSAIYFDDKAIKLATEINATKTLTSAYINIAKAYTFKRQLKISLDYQLKALEISKVEKDSVNIATSFNNIGLKYGELYDYSNALKYCYDAVKINEALGNADGLWLNYNSLHNIYILIKNYSKANDIGNKALEIAKKENKKLYAINTLRKIANMYFDVPDKDAPSIGIKAGQQTTTAFNYFSKAKIVAIEYGNQMEYSKLLNDIAYAYITNGNNDSAYAYYNQCLAIDTKIEDNYSICADKTALGEVNFNIGKYEIANTLCKQALALAQAGDYIDYKQENYRLLHLINEKLGNYNVALSYYKNYNTIKDSLGSDENKKAIMNELVKYDYEKKSIADSIINANEKFIASAKLGKEKNQKLAYGSLALLALAGIGFTFYQYKQKQKTNAQLTEINNKINRQNNTLKTLNTELIVSEENLQKSNSSKEQLISMMSHDLLNPITAITNYNHQIINRKTSNEDLLQAFKTVDAAIQPMHGLLDNMLQWTAIQKDGIAAKLKMQDVNEIVKEIISIYRPQANLKFIKINDALENDFVMEMDKSILSLILRNLLNNAIKYSANDTTINISTSNKTITIQDQGYGMTDEMIGFLNNKQLDKIEAKGSGLGLKLCYEFAEAVGAMIVFTKNKKDGICISITLKV